MPFRRVTRRFRSPSLFWTFTGAFLLVLVLAALLQAFVVVVVVRPLAERWAEDRVRIQVRETAGRIGDLFETASAAGAAEGPSDRAIQEVLRGLRGEPGAPGERVFVLFRRPDGRIVADRPTPMRGRWLERALADDSPVGEFISPPERPRGAPPGERPPRGGPAGRTVSCEVRRDHVEDPWLPGEPTRNDACRPSGRSS